MRDQQPSLANGNPLDSQLSTMQFALEQQRADRDNLAAQVEDARLKLQVQMGPEIQI